MRILTRAEVASLMPGALELIGIAEKGLAAHGKREVVLPPKSHIEIDDRVNGHFNVLPGWAGDGIDLAGVKVISDYVDNWRHGLPSEIGVLALMDPATGMPLALMDATLITAARTGAVTGAGARCLAPPGAKVLAHIGARGSAIHNIAALAALHQAEEVRICSKRPETREKLAALARERLGLKAVALDSIEEAVKGADIVVEATRLEKPQVLIEDKWLKPGCLLVTYGWKMAADPATVMRASKIVVDDWAQCCKGGALHPMIEDGRLTRARVHAEVGEIIAGLKPGRERADETIIFWHRGFAISDIVLGKYLLEQAQAKGVGLTLQMFGRKGGEDGEVV